MRQLLALASSAAVLVGCYVTLSAAFPPLGLIAWISLVSAGAYFTAGGGVRGMTEPMASGTLAILLTIAALYGVEVAGGGLAVLGALVAALAFTIVMLSRIPPFANVPAAFMAAASYVGAGAGRNWIVVAVIISWGAGLVLAFLIDNLSRVAASKTPISIPSAPES
jgi:hypothetical protein